MLTTRQVMIIVGSNDDPSIRMSFTQLIGYFEEIAAIECDHDREAGHLT